MKKGNRTRFVVKGLNQERTLNRLIQKANIYNFKRISHDQCQFESDYNKRKMVKTMLVENGMEVLAYSHFGIFSKLKRFFTSYGLISALILCSLFYGIQYSFIWKIEVYGENKVEEREVKDFVEGCLNNRFKGNIDTKVLEMKIKDNFKEISSLSVAIVGQSLVLNLNEGVLPDEMQGQFQPLVSEFDGLVTEINLIQGTLAVDEGCIVRKGDVLVLPYIIDSQGEHRAVEPKAEIFADVWLSEKVMHYDYQIVVQRTGRTLKTTEVFLNNLLIYSNSGNLDFEEYEVEQEKAPLSYNLLLPFYINKTIYYETETIEIMEEFIEVKDKIINSVREKVLIFLEENEIIKEENYTLREEGGCHEVCYVVTVNRNIGG